MWSFGGGSTAVATLPGSQGVNRRVRSQNNLFFWVDLDGTTRGGG